MRFEPAPEGTNRITHTVAKHHRDDDELHLLLQSFREFSPVYGDHLANHLPMAAIALWRMGADTKQIHRFAKNYVKKLERRHHFPSPPPSLTHVPRRGTHQFEQDAAYFAAQLAASGVEPVLRQWLPRLLPGLSASAFHCLIRTAYAVESGCVAELADALAFWSSDYLDFPMRWIEQDRAAKDIVADTVSAFGDGRDYGGIIVDKMVAVSKEPFFARGLPLPQSLTLEDIRASVLDLYLLGDDFTVLHTVTSTHALQILAPFIDDQDSARRYLWQGLLLAVATVADTLRHSGPDGAAKPTATDWPVILEQARQSLDDHVVKLVFTAWEEWRSTGIEQYRWIAARKAGVA